MKKRSGVLLHFTTLFVILQMIATMVEGKVHYHNFILREKNFTRSCVTKSMFVVNEQFPEPTLYVNKGDTVFINAQNMGNTRVTLHWHGVNQPRNPWSDGPEFITECPIEPGSWFDYDVNLAANEDLKAGGEMPTSNNYLINGLPGDIAGCSEDETFRWRVEYNKTYLLRIVNAAMNAELFFAIAQHNLTIVGTDGRYLKPFDTSFVMISPGQTIDVLVITNQSSSVRKYYMVAKQFINSFSTGYYFDSTNTTAVLEYDNSIEGNEEDGVIFPDTLPSLYDSTAAYHFICRFKSLADESHPIDVPMDITTRMFLVVSMNWLYGVNDDIRQIASSVNNISWVNSETDILQAYYRNMSGVFTDDFSDDSSYYNFTGNTSNFNNAAMRGTKVKMFDYNEQVEIIIQGTNLNETGEDHPMHLHGHNVYRVGFGYGNFDPQRDPTSYNLIDPPAGNTFTVPMNGWIVIRFTANNPGVWLWHCHLDKHLSWGMNTVFITKNGGTPESTMRDPPSNMPSCASSSRIFQGRPQFDNSV